MRDRQKKGKNTKYYIAGGSLVAVLLIVCLVASYSPWSPYAYWWEQETPVVPTTNAYSTIALRSSIDDEVVSGNEYIEYYVPKSSAVFETWDDIRSITLNFEMETRKLAGDFTFDLTEVDFAWIKKCPSGYGSEVFNEDWEFLYYGENGDFTFEVSDDPTDLNFNIIDDTLDEITVASHATNGNYTIVCDVPHYTPTTAQLHVGTGWAMTTAEFDELTISTRNTYYDEAQWCSYDPLYVATDDAMTVEPRYDIEFFTDCPAFKFIFNATAGSVNFTLDDSVDAVLIADGVNLYVIFYEPLVFLDGIQSFDYEIEYVQGKSKDVDVILSDVDFVRVILPKGTTVAPTTVTKISDIAS